MSMTSAGQLLVERGTPGRDLQFGVPNFVIHDPTLAQISGTIKQTSFRVGNETYNSRIYFGVTDVSWSGDGLQVTTATVNEPLENGFYPTLQITVEGGGETVQSGEYSPGFEPQVGTVEKTLTLPMGTYSTVDVSVTVIGGGPTYTLEGIGVPPKPPATLELESASTSQGSVSKGFEATFKARVANTGIEAGTAQVVWQLDGTTVAEATRDIDSLRTETLSVTRTWSQLRDAAGTGTHTLTAVLLAGATWSKQTATVGDFTVVSAEAPEEKQVPQMSLLGGDVSTLSVASGETLTLTADVSNGGEARGLATVTWYLDDTQVGQASRRIGAGSTTTLEDTISWSDLSALLQTGQSYQLRIVLAEGDTWNQQSVTPVNVTVEAKEAAPTEEEKQPTQEGVKLPVSPEIALLGAVVAGLLLVVVTS